MTIKAGSLILVAALTLGNLLAPAEARGGHHHYGGGVGGGGEGHRASGDSGAGYNHEDGHHGGGDHAAEAEPASPAFIYTAPSPVHIGSPHVTLPDVGSESPATRYSHHHEPAERRLHRKELGLDQGETKQAPLKLPIQGSDQDPHPAPPGAVPPVAISEPPAPSRPPRDSHGGETHKDKHDPDRPEPKRHRRHWEPKTIVIRETQPSLDEYAIESIIDSIVSGILDELFFGAYPASVPTDAALCDSDGRPCAPVQWDQNTYDTPEDDFAGFADLLVK